MAARKKVIRTARKSKTNSMPTEKRSSVTAKTHLIEFDFEQFRASSVSKSVSARALSIPSTNSMEIGNDFYSGKKALVEWIGGRGQELVTASRSVTTNQFASDNILGIGVGIRESAGVFTGDLSVKVFVREKVSIRRVQNDFVIPETIDGIPTDVTPIGNLQSYSYAFKYQRPVRGGVSCGHTSITAGTIGCLVVLNDDRLMLLSNNHVLANENNASKGDAILQPGKRDGGKLPNDVIGTLEDFEPIDFASDNLMDAAIAWTALTHVSPQHMTYVANPTPIAAAPLMTVIKNGRTTQATTGWVEAIDVDSVSVEYDSGVARFNDQIAIRGLSDTSFSDRGDSGSLIVSSGSKQPVGLLFAGSKTHTFANPIQTIMNRFGINRIHV